MLKYPSIIILKISGMPISYEVVQGVVFKILTTELPHYCSCKLCEVLRRNWRIKEIFYYCMHAILITCALKLVQYAPVIARIVTTQIGLQHDSSLEPIYFQCKLCCIIIKLFFLLHSKKQLGTLWNRKLRCPQDTEIMPCVPFLLLYPKISRFL